MNSETIRKLLNYYYQTPRFIPEIERATVEFFENKSLLQGAKIIAEDENIEGLFNEWLIFEFKLGNSKTLLEDFYQRNPCNLPMWELQTYKDLQQSDYGLYEILKVDLGQGLELLNLQSKKKYYVNEVSATRTAKPGGLLFNRVCRLGDYFELVGANSISFGDLLRLSQAGREYLSKTKDKLSPKLTKDFLLENLQDTGQSDQPAEQKIELSPEQAKKKLDLLLGRFELGNFVSAGLIQSWINEVKWQKNDNIPAAIVTMLLGLSDGFLMDKIEPAFDLISRIYNQTPQKKIKGKSPKELFGQRLAEDKEPQFEFDSVEIGGDKWHKLQIKARELMQANKFKQAEEKYHQCFNWLLEHKTTSSQIYRLFANYGMNKIYYGNDQQGLEFLKIALELNPNYDFGKASLDNYHKGEYDDAIFKARLKRFKEFFPGSKNGRTPGIKTILKNDPVYIYYQFLRQFKINFKTNKLTESAVTFFGPGRKTKRIKRHHSSATISEQRKIGRNDPCPCGAVKKDGRPIKYKRCCGN